MIRRAARPNRNFLIVDNATVRDERLSLRAIGLLVRILSRPDDWRSDYRSLARECKEGQAAIRSALKELRGAGYIVQTKSQDAKGRWVTETVIYDRPQAEVFVQVAPSADNRSPVDESPVAPRSYKEPDEVPDEDVMEWPAPPSSSRRDGNFTDWRTEDRELFKTIVGDTMTSDGTVWKPAGAHTADVWYDALRGNPTKPMKWPGKYVQSVADREGLYEFFGAYGIEPAA